jgi:hypothetical protein
MAKLSSEQKRFLETTASQYASHLPEAAKWLEGRGIDLDHAAYEGLGVVRNAPAIHSVYEGRLSIPYITDFGPVAFSFRCLKDHKCKDVVAYIKDGKEHNCSKYMRPKVNKDMPVDLYGVRSFDEATNWIGITEGELDSLILRQIGIPAIAIPGASNWEDHWVNVFEDLSRVYVFADADDAGEKLYKKLHDRLPMPVLRVKLPQGEDVNSTFLKYGADAIVSRIKK